MIAMYVHLSLARTLDIISSICKHCVSSWLCLQKKQGYNVEHAWCLNADCYTVVINNKVHIMIWLTCQQIK